MYPFIHGIIGSSGGVVASNDFIIRVKTDNAGTSASNEFTLPVMQSGNSLQKLILHVKDWGDGNTTTFDTASHTHTYATPGVYDITMNVIDYGDRKGLSLLFNNAGDKLKIIDISNFGDIQFRGFYPNYRGCANLHINALDTMNWTSAIGIDATWLFLGCSVVNWKHKFNQTNLIWSWQLAFQSASSYNQLFDIDLRLAGVSLKQIFQNSGMSTANYTDTIVYWANYAFDNAGMPINVNMTLQTGRTFDTSRSGGANFSNAGDARTYLTGTCTWTISGDTVI